MAKYYYKARDRNGSVVSGSIHSQNETSARKSLNKQNLIVLNLSRFNLKAMFSELNTLVEGLSSRVSFEEKMILMNQLETGISVGIPIVQMLNLLQRDLENKTLKAALVHITENITQGSTLHESFALYPQIFDSTVIGLVKTGEVSGKLEATLGRLTSMIEQQAENQAKVKSAIFYPKIVIFVMCGVFFVVVYFIIPKLKLFLASFGAELPWITQAVISTSDFFIAYWYGFLALSASCWYGFKRYAATLKGRYQIDLLKLQAPIIGKLFLNLELNNLCVILELLLDSGVSILDSLETLKESQKNVVFQGALTECQIEIRKGGSLLQGLQNNKIFPSTFKNLLGVGEESGMIQSVLKRLGSYYQVQVDYQLDNLSKLIEPALLLVIFVVVLIIALAVMLPVWQLAGGHPK